MNTEQATQILQQAKQAEACLGNYEKAAEYLRVGDLTGFEEVCRGNRTWLRDKGIPYEPTDGRGTIWHVNGQLCEEATYKDGKLDGPYKNWYANGQPGVEATYKNGKLSGLCKVWHPNGQLEVETDYGCIP